MDIDFSIFDAIIQCLIVVSRKKIVFVNQAFTDHFGWTQKELSNKNIDILYNQPNSHDNIIALLDSLSTEKAFETCELTCRSKTQKDLPCRVTASLIRKNSRTRIVLSHDLLEENFSNSGPSLHNLINFLPDATFAIDSTGKVVFWNHAMEAMTGVAAKDMLGKGNHQYAEAFYGYKRPMLIDLVARPDEEIKKWYQLISRQHNSLIIETTLDRMQAKPANLWAKAGALYDERGRIVGAVETIRDISDQKHLEYQLLQAQKMEAIGTLAGGIAHDFNNLLMGIQGYTDLMLQDLTPDHSHHVKLKRIQEQVGSGADLVRQLLGFAQRGQYERKPLDINSVIESSLAIFTRTHKQIAIDQHFEDNIWPIVADQGQMEQTLMNLFVNANQAMPKGGTLRLKTQNMDLVEPTNLHTQCGPGRYVKISVSDTGIGMDKRTKERIFEPFFTTRSMGRGVGLGLASVYGIIKSHQGFIEVISAPGQGTTFEIYLPAADKIPTPASLDGVSKAQELNTILIVDDEELISDVTQELLESMGYRVLVANGGKEAIEIAKHPSHKIDLIILDMVMPVMGGEETFKHLRAVHPKIKILLSSGYYMSEPIERMLQTGRAAFIQKPYRINELSSIVKKMLHQET